jgi:hypothetical protein
MLGRACALMFPRRCRCRIPHRRRPHRRSPHRGELSPTPCRQHRVTHHQHRASVINTVHPSPTLRICHQHCASCRPPRPSTACAKGPVRFRTACAAARNGPILQLYLINHPSCDGRRSNTRRWSSSVLGRFVDMMSLGRSSSGVLNRRGSTTSEFERCRSPGRSIILYCLHARCRA